MNDSPLDFEKERLTIGSSLETVNQLTARVFELKTALGPLTGHPLIIHPSSLTGSGDSQTPFIFRAI